MRSFYLLLSLLLVLSACSNQTKETKKKENLSKSTVLYLVRHAEKMDDGTKDPHLTEEGLIRAENLKELLKTSEIKRIFSTDYYRTRETAEPLAKELGLTVEIYQPGNGDFTQMLMQKIETNCLIVGHSNSTPTLVNNLIGEQKYAQLDETEYNKIFELKKEDGKFISKVRTFD